MVRFVDEGTRVVVQGITGTQGRFHTRLMLDYGTKVVAGVTPGRGGMEVDGVPVYDTIVEAQEDHELDASIVFVPARFALDAALEAIEAGIDPVVVITEGIPVRDTIEMVARAGQRGTTHDRGAEHSGPHQARGKQARNNAGTGLQGGLRGHRLQERHPLLRDSGPHHPQRPRAIHVRGARRRPGRGPRLRRRP